jgi:hypothetical protein
VEGVVVVAAGAAAAVEVVVAGADAAGAELEPLLQEAKMKTMAIARTKMSAFFMKSSEFYYSLFPKYLLNRF